VAWLAVVNTAFAFVLWNHTLRRLTAVESSVANNTMLVQISILAWVFLGENLSAREILGLVLAALGTLLVQLRRPPFGVRPQEQEASPKQIRGRDHDGPR
jgi:drug/metabolite transporter (DMT)-like permease